MFQTLIIKKVEMMRDMVDVIALIISGISLLISFFVLLRDWRQERFRVDISYVKWFASLASNQPFFIWLIVQNNSKLPVSVLSMELECNRKGTLLKAESHGSKQLMAGVPSGEAEKSIYSLEYPLVLDGFQSVGGYFHFISDAGHFNFEDQTVTLKIITNRGTATKKLELKYSDNIMRAYQYFSGSSKIEIDYDGNPIKYTKENL